MKNFKDKIAVVTGGGTGMGRELVIQLAREGCHVAFCDVNAENMAETLKLAQADAPDGTRLTTHVCDVSIEEQVNRFAAEVVREHETDYVNLVFNNAGIGGGGSIIADSREEWEKTFDVCWGGVYYGTRAFLPLLIASDEGHIMNTSSVNGFWASLGPGIPHTAYSAAKFAVKGFSEALINDLKVNAPHIGVSVVMPGHIGTSIAINSGQILGRPSPKEMTSEDLAPVRERMKDRGLPADGMSDDQMRAALEQQQIAFRDNAPLSAAGAAEIMLDAVRENRWRVLVGEDAKALDAAVRKDPENAYELSFQDVVPGGGLLSNSDD